MHSKSVEQKSCTHIMVSFTINYTYKLFNNKKTSDMTVLLQNNHNILFVNCHALSLFSAKNITFQSFFIHKRKNALTQIQSVHMYDLNFYNFYIIIFIFQFTIDGNGSQCISKLNENSGIFYKLIDAHRFGHGDCQSRNGSS